MVHSHLLTLRAKGRPIRLMRKVCPAQWVLPFPFAWRRGLAHDGTLLRALTVIYDLELAGAERAALLKRKTATDRVCELTICVEALKSA